MTFGECNLDNYSEMARSTTRMLATDAVAMGKISKDSLGEDKYREEAPLLQILVGANCLASEYPFSKGVEGVGRESRPLP